MQFLTFLREGYKETKAQLVLQKVIDMVDDGHIEYSKDKMDINLGKLIKDANLYDLHLIIRKGKKNSVRLGRNKLDNELSIVIDTDYYPQRQNVGKLFAKEDIVKGFQDAFHEYMKKHHEPKDHENKTQHETSKEVNTRKGFERNFKSLEQKIKDKMQEYKAAKAKLDDGLGKSALASHKASHKAALDHLKKEMLGNSAKEFVSKMMKLADEKFSANMDADAKKKLQSRLVSYFEHEFVKDPELVTEGMFSSDYGDDTDERDGPYPEKGDDNFAPEPDHYWSAEVSPDGSLFLYDDGDRVFSVNPREARIAMKNGLIKRPDQSELYDGYYNHGDFLSSLIHYYQSSDFDEPSPREEISRE